MDITAAVQEHRMLVMERARKVALLKNGALLKEDFEREVKLLDSRLGHLAQAFNPRIADKAKRWLASGGNGNTNL